MLQQDITAINGSNEYELDGDLVNLHKFNAWVNRPASISFQPSRKLLDRIAASVSAVNDCLLDNQAVYGVNTGFGGMSQTRIGHRDAAALQGNLLTFLAAGAGPEIDACHTRGAMLLRANVLLQGKSGVRLELIERLVQFSRSDAIPIVREHGSIGASGDLIPLATIARAITGQANKVSIRLDDRIFDSKTALQKLHLQPIQLRAKEGLALVNGTSFSSSIAANATIAARQALAMTFVIQSMLMRALQVNPDPFDPFVHQNKPHPGQIWSARVMRELLVDGASRAHAPSGQVQDRYSLRCFPQYSGSIVEGLARISDVVETEMNSVSDNPLIDPATGQFYQSGNFLGQYLGIAMDDLRRFIGLLAKHLDVQIASLVAPEFNGGLSPSLRGNDQRVYNMGLKGLQICGNSIMPMLTYLANPIVEHFPTHAEQFNQNINGLSWGAANMAWNSVNLYRHYLAVASLFAVQAVDLRARAESGHYDGSQLLGSTGRQFYRSVCRVLSIDPGMERPLLFDDSDRWLEEDIERLATDIGQQDQLVTAVQPIAESFDHFCEVSE